MKNILLIVALLGLSHNLFAAQTVQTVLQNPQSHRFVIPKDINDIADVHYQWTSPSFKEIGFSVSVSTIEAAAQGVVDGVCVSSGAAGDYGVLIDTTGVFAQGSTTVGNFSALVGSQLAGQGRIVAIQTNPLASPTVGAGCMTFDPPLPFTNGLFAQHSTANLWMGVRYRVIRK